jgi:FkbM family methyltransferase
MGIVSYAQNFEDVMLWRALGDVAGGFWIDVGAADPDQFSVTRAFAERGWRGVNIEPTEAPFARLQAARPHDVNLNVALGAADGRLIFHECEDATLSSLDAAVAARNRADGRTVRERAVEVQTLAEVCRRHAPADIHFLKIDVEGAEAQVLAGADFSVFRPWIVVVEATLPMRQDDASAAWEPALLAARYRFAWFDGLNRFYVADERWDPLGAHFRTPPNVFDGFILHDLGDRAQAELAHAQAQLVQARADLAALREILDRSLAVRWRRRLRKLVAPFGRVRQLRP